MLAVHPSAPIEGLDADVIEQLAAMHGGDGVRLGDDEQFRFTRLGAHLPAQHGRRRAALVVRRAREDAKSRGALGHEVVFAAPALQPVMAVAEEHEVPALHPVEQLHDLVDLRRRQRRGMGAEFADQGAHPRPHRRPVAHRGAHVGERGLQVLLQLLQRRRIVEAIDLVQLPGFGVRGPGAVGADIQQPPAAVALDRQHRMHDQVHGKIGAREGHAEGVDQERHVIGDREHERVRGLEAVGVGLGIEDPHQRAPVRAARREGQVRQRRARELLGLARRQVLFGNPVEVGAQVAWRQVPARTRADALGDALDQRHARGRDAVELVVIFNSNCVHARSFLAQGTQQHRMRTAHIL